MLIGLAGAVATWVIVTLIFRAALFLIGGVAGAVIGAKLYSVLNSDRNVAVSLIFAAGFACLCGGQRSADASCGGRGEDPTRI